MSSILDTERLTYEEVWGSVATYHEHSPGVMYLPLFLQLVGAKRGTVLDAGCGSGRGSLALAQAGFDVTMCDLTPTGVVEEAKHLPFVEACLWHPIPHQFDWVYCTDVLEHVPTQLTMLTIAQLLDAATDGLFLAVSLANDNQGAWVGHALHQTVQSFVWWRDSLREIGVVVEARDLVDSACYLVRHR